jgi:hypothetical protein
MTNYDIFDEKYYLASYPWVKPAIDAGVIQSGRDHFETFGQAAGLTQVSRYFDEATYLAGNPDIAALVRTPNNPNAPFATGLDHFIQYGYEEGRTRVSPEYDEAFYLANNRQLQPFIQNGTFKNGYQHFIKFGIKDGQFGTSFFETEYLEYNFDVRPFVNSGALKTGREHYFNFGKNDPSRSATFIGSPGNDIITGAGVGNSELIGVEVGFVVSINSFTISGRNYESDGSNEFDTLTGGSGRDLFKLGELLPGTGGRFFRPPTILYIGPGFATIRNFTQGQDSIQLASDDFQVSLDKFLIFPINNNRDLAIQTNGLLVSLPDGSSGISRFDTIAVIEGGGNLKLKLLPSSNAAIRFLIG